MVMVFFYASMFLVSAALSHMAILVWRRRGLARQRVLASRRPPLNRKDRFGV